MVHPWDYIVLHIARLLDLRSARLLSIENQAADLNRLPVRSLRRTGRIREGRVRGEPSSVNLGIIALDEGDLVGCLVGKVVPLVVRVVLHAERA